MDVSISKSVGRAFEVMELFKEMRRPATATEIRKRLNHPHSSVVAVLHNLAELGYLSYNTATRLYFPTARFGNLGVWVQPTLKGTGRLGELVKMIALETGQTSAIACRNSIFLNIVHVAVGSHSSAIQFSPGIGFVLCRSIPGLALISQLPDERIAQLLQQTERWIDRTHMAEHVETPDVWSAIAKVRADGMLVSPDCSIRNVGVVAYPLASPFDENPLAISVSGPTHKVKAESATICQIMEHYLMLHARRGTEDWPRFNRPPTLRGAGGFGRAVNARPDSARTFSRPRTAQVSFA